jgi:glycosyltransferase involved in cell wall biosynthesis
MTAGTILHVTSLFGGGVDRHLRDLVRTVPRPHLLWHAGEGVDVLEDPAAKRFHPLAPGILPREGARLSRWLRARRIGLVHLHATTLAPRERARWARETLGVAQVATLHDILFLRPDAFSADDPLAPDAAWLAQTSAELRESKTVLAPSRWLADLAAERIPGLRVQVVPNGSDSSPAARAIAPRADFSRRKPGSVVALLGAVGPHKGSGFVDAIAELLEGRGVCLVVIGYLEQQLHPGWRRRGSLFVHGAFAEGDAPGLLRGYGAKLALFPNVAPESFSYALSDAWAAGVPVLAAPRGALAERIGGHGGGWLLPEAFDAEAVAGEILALVGGARDSERAQVQSLLATPDADRVPPLETMTRSLEAFYARFGIDPAAPGEAGDEAIQSLLATNLDGTLFRQELARLSDELAQTLAALADTQARADAFERESRGWIAKLEADVKAVQEDLRKAGEETDRARKEADLMRLNKEALDRLPSPVRRLLLKWAFNARR